MTGSNTSGIRILVGAGSFADAAAALEIIKRATRRLQITLGGRLIVDQRALALCHLPNQRIVSTTGALVIAPSQEQMNALIKADAKAFRKSLAELADPIGATWMFEQSTGDLVGDALKGRAAWDVIVFGQRAIHRARGKIIVIAPERSSNQVLTDFANTLAGQSAADRVDLTIGVSTKSDTANLTFSNVEAAISAVSRVNAQAVLLDLSKGLVQGAADLERLLEAARCPVFVFGAASTEAMLEHNTHFPPDYSG